MECFPFRFEARCRGGYTARMVVEGNLEPIESIDRSQTSDAPLPAESETSQPPELEW
ncbi:Uncharacterised protein [Mycobacteroides abscessus subsp. abscessus]|nr:Uncharacterised protein [Mycobacteroides abscessus subsp. abscessus]